MKIEELIDIGKTRISFEKWWKANGTPYYNQKYIARKTWEARESEIAKLKAEIESLENTIEDIGYEIIERGEMSQGE